MPNHSAAVVYVVTPQRTVMSVVSGALTGAFAIALWYVWGLYDSFGIQHIVEYGFAKTLTVFVVAVCVWALGLLGCGVPLWYLLHRFGYRSWQTALVLGVAATFIVALAIQTNGFDLIPPPPGSTYSASDSGGATVINNRLTAHGW